MHDREPHFGTLQSRLLAIGEGEALFVHPALAGTHNDGTRDLFGLGAAMIGLAKAEQERVDGVEQIAGRVGRP